eukprot:gene2353-3649_t
MTTVFDFAWGNDIDGKPIDVEKLRGSVLLLTNEPGKNAAIKDFAYQRGFPHPPAGLITDKVNDGNPVVWNFEKYLINRKGCLVKRYAPKDGVIKAQKAPTDELLQDIERCLAETA